jgi:SAM-dependent methyltransferase
MLFDDSDRSWEEFGQKQPYFGVLSGDEYRTENLSDEARRRFFASGHKHWDRLLPLIERHFGPPDYGGTAVDFGCGAGRVTVHLAALFKDVIGIDVSASMLRVAEANCKERGIDNARFLASSGGFPDLPQGISFIHSALVFQHIPRRRGEAIVERLLAALAPGGIAAFHFYLADEYSPLRSAYWLLRNRIFPIQIAKNLVRHRPWNEPVMQMNHYDAGRLLAIAAAHGIGEIALQMTEGGGAMLLLRKG